MFTATNIKTGEVTEMTEAQVKAEIIDTFQHDMSTALEYSDEEIAKGINEGDIKDHFYDGEFEGMTYKIIAA